MKRLLFVTFVLFLLIATSGCGHDQVNFPTIVPAAAPVVPININSEGPSCGDGPWEKPCEPKPPEIPFQIGH